MSKDSSNLSAPLESVKAYRARVSYLLNALDEYEADIGSILANINDLRRRAAKGFDSDRVNMKAEDGVTRLNEAAPTIEVSCLQMQLKANEMMVKIMTMDEQPDTNISVVINPVALEDRL